MSSLTLHLSGKLAALKRKLIQNPYSAIFQQNEFPDRATVNFSFRKMNVSITPVTFFFIKNPYRLSRLFAPKRLEGNSYQLEADVSMPRLRFTETNLRPMYRKLGKKRQPKQRSKKTQKKKVSPFFKRKTKLNTVYQQETGVLRLYVYPP